MSRPVLRVARATLAESMNWTASADTAWSDDEIDEILLQRREIIWKRRRDHLFLRLRV